MKKHTVTVLPYVGDKVLMQLRDMKEGIPFPGHWGFFGGSMEAGEIPRMAAERELYEEITYCPDVMYELNTVCIPDLQFIVAHGFYCPLMVPMCNLIQNEGLDMGLFSLEDVCRKELYSSKLKGTFPVAPTQYIVGTFERFLKRLIEGHQE